MGKNINVHMLFSCVVTDLYNPFSHLYPAMTQMPDNLSLVT